MRKAKDDINGHKDKSVKVRKKSKSSGHHPALCKDCAQSNKCNIQKVSRLTFDTNNIASPIWYNNNVTSNSSV